MKSLGQEALEAGLCTAVACFEYDEVAAAKRAWERAAERSKREDASQVSINRLLLPSHPDVQFVIVAGEDAGRVELVAQVLKAGGRRVDPPELALEATAAKRAQLLARNKDTRVVGRYGAGSLFDTDGHHLGPLRRPQG